MKFIIALFCLIGTIGSMEVGRLPVLTGIVLSILFILVMVVSYYGKPKQKSRKRF